MATCPCDDRIHPPLLDIAAGLSRLPRQIAGFPEFRRALLAGIDEKAALDEWRARDGDDFGIMILEWWAYVSDVLAFYSGEIANESYLRTAAREASLRRLVELIGYSPKPALAASATLALFAEPGQPLSVPAGTAFRSDAFDGEAPQIFESDADATIDASRNRFRVSPVHPDTFGSGPLLLETRGAGVRESRIALLTFGSTRHAARASRVREREMLDGNTYVEVTLDPAASIGAGQDLADIGVFVLALRAGMSVFAGDTAVDRGGGKVELILDAVHPQVRTGATVVLEGADVDELHAAEVTVVGLVDKPINAETDTPTAPFTLVTLDGDGPSWIDAAAPTELTLHFHAVPAGRVARPARSEIALTDLQPSAPLDGPTAPLERATASQVLLRDALEQGVSLAANVTDDGEGNATLTPLTTASAFASPLRPPVEVFGNLVSATRGESVEEVLGSGDATQSFQTFRLKKKPLTYLSVPGSTSGRKSTLEVWVDGVRWSEVTSLFLASSSDRVYTVRQTVDGETEITFGGQGFGQPLPSGASNVRAAYRYGAGAASPPAGALRQAAKPVQGLRRVLNPLAAFGGDDGDQGGDIRKAAPDSALSLGRAVSLLDFEAIARGYRGIINATALMAWDDREQRAAVTVWFIPPSPDQADQLRIDLQAHLRTIAAPGTAVTAKVADEHAVSLAIDFVTAADRDDAEVESAVIHALTDDEDGLLSPRNVTIGAPVFRADILAAARAVDGVDEVRGLLAGGASAPFAITVADEGEYVAATVVRSS